MSDFQAIADRVEIEALRGEFTDAAMMCDYDRVASLFTPDGALRMPNVPVELVGRDQIRAWRERREAFVEYFVQTAHPGTIQLDGDAASGRAYLHELIGLRDGGSHQNFAIYHDRYQRTGDGWKFTERLRGEIPGHDSAVRYSAPGRGIASWPAGREQPCGAMTCDAAGHTSSRIFPWIVRLARRTCASDARCRGKRSAMRGLNRPAVSWLTITPTASARSCWLAR